GVRRGRLASVIPTERSDGGTGMHSAMPATDGSQQVPPSLRSVGMPLAERRVYLTDFGCLRRRRQRATTPVESATLRSRHRPVNKKTSTPTGPSERKVVRNETR